MAKPPSSSNGLFDFLRRKRRDPFTPWHEIRQREVDASLAVLHERRKMERHEDRTRRVASYWPLAIGLVLSMFAPLLKEVAESLGPWAMTLFFPFVVVARRPEVYVGNLTHVLPTIVLYAQFPIEGLFARLVLKRGLKPVSVAGQVCMFHLLGILELVMLTNLPGQLLRR